MNTTIAAIKAEIKTLSVELRNLKFSIKLYNRDGRWDDLRSAQRQYRSQARRCRHLFVAYGLMRGMAYDRIECPREGNCVDWKAVEEIRNVSAAA